MPEVRVTKCGGINVKCNLTDLGRLLILNFQEPVSIKKGEDLEVLLLYKKYILTWVDYNLHTVDQKVVRSRENKYKVLYNFIVLKLPLCKSMTHGEALAYVQTCNIGVIVREI